MANKVITTGKDAVNLTMVYAYSPEDNSFVFTDQGLLKVDRILVFSDPCGNLTIKRILAAKCGARYDENSVYLKVRFSSCITNNSIDEDAIETFCSWYSEDDDSVAEDLQRTLGEWGISTVLKEDGSTLSLQNYINETILNK